MNDPFERLAPPPGGLAGLRRKLEARERPGGERRDALAGLSLPRVAAGLMAVLAVMAVGYRLLPSAPPAPDRGYGIFQPYMENNREPVRLAAESSAAGLNLVEQRTSNSAIRFYWIEEAPIENQSEAEGAR